MKLINSGQRESQSVPILRGKFTGKLWVSFQVKNVYFLDETLPFKLPLNQGKQTVKLKSDFIIRFRESELREEGGTRQASQTDARPRAPGQRRPETRTPLKRARDEVLCPQV